MVNSRYFWTTWHACMQATRYCRCHVHIYYTLVFVCNTYVYACHTLAQFVFEFCLSPIFTPFAFLCDSIFLLLLISLLHYFCTLLCLLYNRKTIKLAQCCQIALQHRTQYVYCNACASLYILHKYHKHLCMCVRVCSETKVFPSPSSPYCSAMLAFRFTLYYCLHMCMHACKNFKFHTW